MPYLGVVGRVVSIGGASDSFEWTLPAFRSLRGGHGDNYASPPFRAFDRTWGLCVYPFGMSPFSSFVAVNLNRSDLSPPLPLLLTLGIRGEGAFGNTKEMSMEFNDGNPECIWNRFAPRSQLGAGDVVLSLRMQERGVVADASIQTDAELEGAGFSPGGKEFTEKRGVEKFVEDIGELLASGKKSDVTVQVKGSEFKVHGSILTARSPVLSAMLEHDTVERESGKIRIDDCDPDVFEKYLAYLYTGSAQPLTRRIVFGLHAVADKYLAGDLKLECLEHIRSTLCVQTFCDAVKLALTHGESDLLQLAIDFASENIQQIIVSVEWQRFNCERPIEATEILVKCLGPGGSVKIS